jgi:hypothetical protein
VLDVDELFDRQTTRSRLLCRRRRREPRRERARASERCTCGRRLADLVPSCGHFVFLYSCSHGAFLPWRLS